MFQSAFDIAGKTLLQCYLIDEEMFVGEQRFACKEVLAFIEFHKNDEVEQAKFGKLQQYVKGMKASLNPNVPIARDEDPDEEENKKLEQKKKKGSDESGSEEEEEEEEEEQKPQPKKPEKGSDESSSEEESEEEDDDESGSEEEESEEENDSNLFAKNMFGANSQANHQTFNVDMSKIGTVKSLQASTVHVNANKSNLSGFGKTAISMEKMDESRDTLFRVSGNDFKNNKNDVSNLSMSDAGSAKSQTNLLKLNTNKGNDKSAVRDKSHVFGGWNDLQNELEGKNNNKDHSLWKPLESSVISNGSAHSRRPLGRRPGTGERPDTGGSESVMNLMDASAMTHQTKIIDKSVVNNNNTMRSDIHNVFNKSKIQQSTMKLEYDDDEEDNSKYRL